MDTCAADDGISMEFLLPCGGVSNAESVLLVSTVKIRANKKNPVCVIQRKHMKKEIKKFQDYLCDHIMILNNMQYHLEGIFVSFSAGANPWSRPWPWQPLKYKTAQLLLSELKAAHYPPPTLLT